MNFLVALVIPVVLGWFLMLLVLGPLHWGLRQLIRIVLLRIKLAVILAIRPIEAALYNRLGGKLPRQFHAHPRSRELDCLEHLAGFPCSKASRGTEQAWRSWATK